MALSRDLEIPLQVSNPGLISEKLHMTPVIAGALFRIVKIGKQPKCPITDEWIKKSCYVHNEVLVSCEKRHNFAICFKLYRIGGCQAK